MNRVAPRNDLRFLARVGRGDREIEHPSAPRGGEQRHFRLELKTMPGGKPRTEPRAAHQAKSALAVANAAAAQQPGHDPIRPAAHDRHPRGVGQAVPHDQVGVETSAPKTFQVGRVMLAVAIEEKKPIDRSGQPPHRVPERGRLAVMRSGRRHHLRARLPRQKSGRIAAGIVDDRDRKPGAPASPHHPADGRRLVARRNENQRRRLPRRANHVGRSLAALRGSARLKPPRAYRLG